MEFCLEKTNANAKESFKKLVIKVKRKTILKKRLKNGFQALKSVLPISMIDKKALKINGGLL